MNMEAKKDESVAMGLAKVGIYMILLAVIYFVCAGRMDNTLAWIYFVVVCLNTGILSFLMEDDLIKERSGLQENSKKWDIFPALIIGRIGPLLILAVAGFDARFRWSGEIPLYVMITSFLLMVAGLLITDWAVLTNRYFSGLVRIQKDRGHTVIETGPYGFIRHPGYAGAIIANFTTALIMNSLWAMIPAVFVVIVTIIRTALEDRTLKLELDGYSSYAERVRHRLLPGIW